MFWFWLTSYPSSETYLLRPLGASTGKVEFSDAPTANETQHQNVSPFVIEQIHTGTHKDLS